MALGSYFAWRCKAAPSYRGPHRACAMGLGVAAENSWPAPLQPGFAAGKSPLGKAACAALFRLRHTVAANEKSFFLPALAAKPR
jgi:hypothetical protein